MLLTVLLLTIGQLGGPCTLRGTVELHDEDNAPLNPGNVIVYVRDVPATAFKRTTSPHVIRQANRTFVPAVMVVQEGETIAFTNEDKEAHQVFTPSRANSFGLPASKKGTTGLQVFTVAGTVPLRCNLHASMRGEVLVVKNPFFASAGSDGRWSIPGLPVSNYTLVAWEPNGKEVEVQVQVQGCQAVPPLKLTQARLGPSKTMTNTRYSGEYSDLKHGVWKH